VAAFVDGLFDVNRDLKAYKTLLRDFLVDVLELRGVEEEDGTGAGGLYAEERAAAAAAAAAAQLQRQAAVPGLLTPYQMGAQDDDL
jgi:hypothetical protein